jgi:hypothetical protein
MTASDASDATFTLKKAIRNVILADATLNAALVGQKVVDEAPSSHPTPYISMETSSDDWSTATEDGQEFFIDLHVWTQSVKQTPETATGRDIMASLRRVLHTATLSLSSPFNSVLIRVQGMNGPFRDPDETTLHGVVSIRVIVDHT